jgi:hypothetical protein
MKIESKPANARPKKPTDWKKRFGAAKPPHVVMLHSDFAGVRAGSTMLISSPADIAGYIATIPNGERRSIARMRGDLARRAGADAMCPVTTAIYLRIVAELALSDLDNGKDLSEVPPFWRLIGPDDKVSHKLSCGTDGLLHLQRLDSAAPTAPPPATGL